MNMISFWWWKAGEIRANVSAIVGNILFLWFKFVLESQVVECSMESFMHKDYTEVKFICLSIIYLFIN